MIYSFIPASLEVCSLASRTSSTCDLVRLPLLEMINVNFVAFVLLRAAVKIHDGCLRGTKRRRVCNESGAHTVDCRFFFFFIARGGKIIHYSERMLQGCCSTAQYFDNPADVSVVPSLCIRPAKVARRLQIAGPV